MPGKACFRLPLPFSFYNSSAAETASPASAAAIAGTAMRTPYETNFPNEKSTPTVLRSDIHTMCQFALINSHIGVANKVPANEVFRFLGI